MNVNEILTKMYNRGASDLHLTVGIPPTMRLHGHLTPMDYPVLGAEDTRRLIYSILAEEKRRKLEENWECDLSYTVPEVSRFRVNVYFQKGFLAAAFRVIPINIKSFEDLNLPPILEEIADRPRGFVVVTGPTGSGKSSTLAAMIDRINSRRHDHIMTIEDPIEFLHKHKECVVNQREIGADTKSFGDALKYVLRQDPDIILVGEMRDLETIQAALTAAETGHLVFATLHTQDAPQTIDRIIDVFPPHQQQQIRVQLAGSMQGIVSQQLMPTVDGQGRVVAVEILVPTPGIRSLIREGKTHQIYSLMQTGQKFGMQTMDASLADLYKRGKITWESALMKSHDTENLRQLAGKAG